ncbi:uncharacterized protein LOC62_07G009394 [Vanrija pseudolonga]|uniref:Uncharacterized protein n=1 Tax=Vanrija pseudolonga TaxID=143232 RepID=A0AAF0YG06_9TREE|nr:hypothetical protein LOC62_07G009394 [Vanrija pseudolonga]
MTAISPMRNRFDYASAMHPTSSLRDPPPNATPPVGSRSPSARATDDRDDRRKGKAREREDLPDDDDKRPDKRSRTHARGSGRLSGDSPSKLGSGPSAPGESQSTGKSRPPGLAPIKPIGFAASREARREDGTDRAIPSPVVMGFDFKSIDEEQLKTVRDTISIKEQQQALIAQRRKEMAASQPTTPRELTFKGWTPKETEKRSVGVRREKTRDKVERMSIVTSNSDKDVVPGSKSAPLNQGLASQQQSPREPPSGSQTAMPQHILPPMHSHYHQQHHHHLADPRTAPVSHTRSGRPEENNFARQQQPYYQATVHPGPPGGPPSATGSTHRTSQDTRYPEISLDMAGPRSARPQPQPSTADRRTFSVTGIAGHPSAYPPSPHARGPPPGPSSGVPPPQRASNGHHRGNGGYSASPSPPHQTTHTHHREQFLAPFSQLYDLLGSVDNLRYSLQDMIHRGESAYAAQMAATADFKATAAQAGNLLATLQQSAESLKEMVRYEVDRAGSAERREVDDLRDRIRLLEERLDRR